MIKGVIFDMDGLMFDTERVYGKYWREVSRELGYPMTDDMVTYMCGATRDFQVGKFVEWFGEDVPADAIISGCHERTNAQVARHPIPLKPGLHELLVALRERGIPAVIATGSARVWAEDKLTRSGMAPYFAGMVCGDEVAACKPDPEIFLTAAALIGVSPQDCAVLEDSFNGIIAARAAGAQPIMIPDCIQPTEEIRLLCDHVLTRLDEVIAFL